MSKRRMGIGGTEGLKQRTLCEGASPSAQLIHQELHDNHKKLPTRRLPRRRRRPARSDPKKLTQKGGTAVPYAAVDSRYKPEGRKTGGVRGLLAL